MSLSAELTHQSVLSTAFGSVLRCGDIKCLGLLYFPEMLWQIPESRAKSFPLQEVITLLALKMSLFSHCTVFKLHFQYFIIIIRSFSSAEAKVHMNHRAIVAYRNTSDWNKLEFPFKYFSHQCTVFKLPLRNLIISSSAWKKLFSW